MTIVRSWSICSGMLLVGALIISSCAPKILTNDSGGSLATHGVDGYEAAAEGSKDLPPPFRASGFEPPWSMEWNGNTLTVSVGIGEETSKFADLVSQASPKGWFLAIEGDFELRVLRNGCLDLAGEFHDFDIDAMVLGQRLVGCGDETG